MKRLNVLTLLLATGLSWGLVGCDSQPQTSTSTVDSSATLNEGAKIEISGPSDVYVGQKVRFTAAVQGAEHLDVTFKSSDPTVLSIDDTGLAEGLKLGSATVTAYLAEGGTASLAVTVKDHTGEKLSVQFVNYDGTLLYETSVEFGQPVSFQGQEPKRTSTYEKAYVFKGWDQDLTSVKTDLVVRAVYEELNNVDFVFVPISAGGDSGYMLYFYLGDAEEITIPELYQGKPVTRVDTGAFAYAKNLKKITFPNTISQLGDQAFYDNETIEEVYIPDSVYDFGSGVFEGCTHLKKVRLPNGLVTLPESTFEGCSALTDVELPSTVTKIGESAFEGCTSLASIAFPAGIAALGDSAFQESGLVEVTLPNSVTEMGDYVFRECASLATVVWNKTLTAIPESTFRECTSLKEFAFPSTLTTIGDSAFYEAGLTSLQLPDTITSIGRSAFEGNEGLTSVKWTKGIKSVPASVFSSCTNLTSITDFDEVTEIGRNAFEFTGFKILDHTNVFASPVLTSVANYAFMSMPNLTSVTVPGNVKTFAARVFQNNKLLSTVTFQEGVESLGENLFYNCASLRTVSFPNSLRKYGSTGSSASGLFLGSPNIESIDLGDGTDDYISIDGVVYSKDKALLLEYPSGNSRTSYQVAKETKTIAKGAFQYAKNLTAIDLESVTKISSRAFGDTAFGGANPSAGLVSLTTPASLTDLESYSLAYMTKLQTLDLSQSKSLTQLLSSVAINCTALTTVKLPDTLTKIGSGAFNYDTALTSINLPLTLESVGSGAFRHANRLVVTYAGTKAQWAQVELSSNAFASGAVIRCTDGDVNI